MNNSVTKTRLFQNVDLSFKSRTRKGRHPQIELTASIRSKKIIYNLLIKLNNSQLRLTGWILTQMTSEQAVNNTLRTLNISITLDVIEIK